MKLFAPSCDDKPAVQPTVDGLSGLKKLAVTQACVAAVPLEFVLITLLVMLIPVPAESTSCFKVS